MVRFGDTIGPVFTSTNAASFLNKINSLRAEGGGACPELSQSALQSAIFSSRKNSTLFLFTDASAEDDRLSSSVNTAAQEKRISITPLITGSCSPIDPVYERNARETGGQLFVLDPSEVSKTFDLVRSQLSGRLTPIMLVNSSLNNSSQIFDIPIDSTITKAVISLSVDAKQSIVLRNPSGDIVTSSEDAIITNLNTGSIFTLNAPKTGIWKLEVTGYGSLSLSVQADSSLELIDFDFVSVHDSDAHRGLFPINGQPVIETAQTARATLLGEFATASFEIVNEEGNLIQSLALSTDNGEAAAEDFIGVFTPPDQYFRLAVTGSDRNGASYRRLFPTLFRAQPISITINSSDKMQVAVGQTTKIKYTVKNWGSQDTFQVIASSNGDYIRRVQPSSLTLSSNRSGEIVVDVYVPKGTPLGSSIMLSAVISSRTNTDAKNGMTVNLTAVRQTFLPIIRR